MSHALDTVCSHRSYTVVVVTAKKNADKREIENQDLHISIAWMTPEFCFTIICGMKDVDLTGSKDNIKNILLCVIKVRAGLRN